MAAQASAVAMRRRLAKAEACARMNFPQATFGPDRQVSCLADE